MTDYTRIGQLSAANTTRDGTGTLVDLVTAGTYGSKVSQVDVIAPGTVTAGVVRLYLYDGTNTRLLTEILVPATTPSTSVACWQTTYRPSPQIELPAGWKLRASTNNAETFNVTTKATDN